jgi:hypothetical protein
MEKAVQRTLIDRGREVLKAEPTDKSEDENHTILKFSELRHMCNQTSEILNSAGCDIPKEIIGTIIIGVVAMWSGKTVKLFDDTKGNN